MVTIAVAVVAVNGGISNLRLVEVTATNGEGVVAANHPCCG